GERRVSAQGWRRLAPTLHCARLGMPRRHGGQKGGTMADSGAPGWRIVLFTDFAFMAAWHKDFFARAGHRLVAVVNSSRRSPGSRDVARAAQPESAVLVSSHPRRWAGMLAPLRPDLVVASGFPLRLPPALLALPRLGAVNMHPSLLPRYRGTDTPLWVL